MKEEARVRTVADLIETNDDLERLCPEILVTLKWVLED